MATVVFKDPGVFMKASFPKVSDFEDEQLFPGSEISSDYGFEDIVGNSYALNKVLEQVAIVVPTNATVLLHGETERERNSLPAEFTRSVIAMHRRLIKLMTLALLAATMLIAATTLTAEPRCSANLAVQASRSSSNRHQVILEAYINNAGPYAFLLDTGSQVTMIDESLASELNLRATSTATLVGVSLQGKGGRYALANSVRVGDQAKVESLYVLSFDMKDIGAAGYSVRGLIGEDFLSHFDETIDNTHNRVCFTQVGRPAPGQHQGVRVPGEQRPKIK